MKEYKEKQKAEFVGLDNQSKLKTDAGQQMETMYASTIQRFEERNEELQQSRFQVGGVKYKDGSEMRLVKFWQGKLAEKMREPIPHEKAVLDKEFSAVELIYDSLIYHCKQYIETHRHPFTSSGKARLHLVKGTLSLAVQEHAKVKEKAEELRENAARKKKQLVWGNVLGLIRGSDFDLDKMKGLDTGGAMTSEVQIIKSGKSTFYFKEEEKLEPPMEAFQKRYLNDNANGQDQEIYRRLEAIIKHKESMNTLIGLSFTAALKEAKKPESVAAVCKDIQKQLKKYGVTLDYLDFSDPHVQKIAKDVLPRVEMWMNRVEACNMAGIGMGESLSKRNILTSRMAIIMNVPHLVALSNKATLHRGGQQQREGIVMEEARGKEFAKVYREAEKNKKQIVYTSEALRQYSCLQLFDTVCGQVDRHYGNRFVQMIEEDTRIIITGVQGIDHDLSFGKWKYDELKELGRGQMAGFEDGEPCAIPALDEEMVEFLRALSEDKDDLKYYLGDLLEGEYMDALGDRLQGVVNAIDRMVKEKPDLLVKKEDWNMDVAKRFVGVVTTYASVGDGGVTEEPQQQKTEK